MNVKIITSKKFRKKAKPLLKKYHSLKDELLKLKEYLLINPELGTYIGNGCYKIRLAVKSKRKGKAGGLRVITYVVIKTIKKNHNLKVVNLVTVYDKSEYENISDRELQRIIMEINDEIKN